MQELYDKSFEELQNLKFSKSLTDKGFSDWKKFVDYVIEKEFTELFISKFIQPADFQTIYNNGFTEDHWEVVILKILSTGIKPEHNLYFRIPEFKKIVDKSEGRIVVKKSTNLKNQDYGNMRKD